jgi:succinate dehydrogenase / fumarate reductase flavoprotein subunit
MGARLGPQQILDALGDANLARRGRDVVVISQSARGGSLACSGSNTPTIHTANTADQGGNHTDMAQAIRAGGAMDEDTAHIAAVGSGRALVV